MSQHPNPLDHRTADHDIESLLLRRWSPRAMNGDSLDEATLMRLLEAARWAPSANNVQEWRFVYALRTSPHWQAMFDVLAAGNQAWCNRAGALLLIASCTRNEQTGRDNGMHAFDTGLAAQNLLLQGTAMGLVTHAMAGFDRAAARTAFALPDIVQPQAMVAVGYPGDPEALPEQKQAGDLNPNGRMPISEFAFEGRFPA